MKLYLLFLLYILLQFDVAIGASIVRLRPNLPISMQLHSKENTTYIISSPLSLGNDTLMLPPNSTLLFVKNGRLKDGYIRFNKTKIKGNYTEKFFENCLFSGDLYNKKLRISMFGVKADGKTDDGPVINSVLSLIDGKFCELIFDCDGDYGISSYNNKCTLMVGSNTTITFTGKGFLKLLVTSKLGAVLSLKESAHDVVINNIQIDGGGEKVIVGNSGQNGIGAGHFKNFTVNGGTIRNCFKGKDVYINGALMYGDGGKGIQIESADCKVGKFDKIKIENCHAALSCRRDFLKKEGIDVAFSNIYANNCEQFAIIHQANGEDTTGEEQKVAIKNFVAKNCGYTDGVFIFSRTRYLTIENGRVEGNVKTPAIFRGRIAKSVINNVSISQPCISVVNLNPSTYGEDQRESSYNYFNLSVNTNYDYLILSDTEKKVPYRSMTKSLISATCNENPQKSVYSNEVNSSGMLNIKLKLPENRFFEGPTTVFDCEYGARYDRLNSTIRTELKTEGTKRLRPRNLTAKEIGFAYWNTDASTLEVWDGNQWGNVK